MGSGVTLSCPGCPYELEVILGVGFAYYSLENVIDRVHPGRRASIPKILRDHRVEHTTYQHAPISRYTRLWRRFSLNSFPQGTCPVLLDAPDAPIRTQPLPGPRWILPIHGFDSSPCAAFVRCRFAAGDHKREIERFESVRVSQLFENRKVPVDRIISELRAA